MIQCRSARPIAIAYATRAGSTREVAHYIGNIFLQHGKRVDVLDVKAVKHPEQYAALVLGTNIRAGQVMPEILRFAQHNAAWMVSLPKAYFVVCGTLRTDTPDTRAIVEAYLEPLVRISPPLSKGLFAGRIDPQTMDLPWRLILKSITEGSMTPGDFRRWDLIRAWAESVIKLLEQGPALAGTASQTASV
ncbi:MAG: flavodoxin domain-containing protein [Anaerolineae bacterium]